MPEAWGMKMALGVFLSVAIGRGVLVGAKVR
jgi:hypothetical protein